MTVEWRTQINRPKVRGAEAFISTFKKEDIVEDFTVIKYVFSLVGAALLAGAIILYNNTTSFLERSETAQGTVVELIRSRSSDSTSYYPVVQFAGAEAAESPAVALVPVSANCSGPSLAAN